MVSKYREKSGRRFALPLTVEEALKIMLAEESRQ
jgi:hypothetical protein